MGASSTLLKLLEQDSEVLAGMVDKFARLTKKSQIHVFCFWESQKSDVATVLQKALPFKTPGFKSMEYIVDKHHATYDGVDNLRLASDHFKLNKYSGPKDENFRTVANEIKTAADKAMGIIKSRQSTARQALINDKTYRALINTLGKGFSDTEATIKGTYTGSKGDEPSKIVVDKECYKQWKEQDTLQVIWVHGAAGTGQGSIASSIISVINKTKAEESMVTSFFCDQSDENRRSLQAMLRLLIRQVIETDQDLAVKLLTDSKKSKSVTKQDYDPDALQKVSVLWDALQAMAKEITGGCIYVVLHGIDQLSAESLEQFLQYMKELPDKGTTLDEDVEVSPIKWLLFSRSGRPNIGKCLTSKAHEVKVDDPVNAKYVSDALRAIITARIDELELSAPLSYFVKRHIHYRAEGNSIYVSLVVQELKNALDSGMRKHSEIRALLESLPFGLTDMFEHVRKRILRPTAEGVEYTKEILRCLVLAQRAPTLRELAIMADLPEEHRQDLEQLKIYLIRCGAFIALRGNPLDEDNMKVEWIEIAAQDHLKSSAKEELALDAERKSIQHGIIALRCLEYVYSITGLHGAAETIGNVDDEARQEDNESEDLEHENEEDIEHDAEQHDEEDSSKVENAPTEAGNEEDDQEFDKDEPLSYPVQYWIEHAKLAPVDVIEEFRMSHAFWEQESAARQEWWSFNDSMHVEPNQTNVSPLHVATIGEFPAFVDYCKHTNPAA
jgi:hypothetical protein